MSSRYQKNNKKVMQAFTMIMQFGINMIVPIFLCTFLGIYLGNQWNLPVLSIPFFIVGALAGFTNVYRMAKGVYEDKSGDGKPAAGEDKKHVQNVKKN